MSNQNHLRLTKLALSTGFRRSELLSLSWKNLDLVKDKIYVQRKECAASGSSSSMRIVPLPAKAKKLLRSFESKQGKVLPLIKGSARNGFDKARKKH